MTTLQKIVSSLLVLWLVVLTGVVCFTGTSPAFGTINGAIYDGLAHWFGSSLYVGTTQQFGVSSSGNVSTTGTLNSGLAAISTTTPSALGDLVIDGVATTTVMIASSGASGGCLQMENSAGTQTKAYIAGTSWVIAAGTCK
jgi:hypothetical protein